MEEDLKEYYFDSIPSKDEMIKKIRYDLVHDKLGIKDFEKKISRPNLVFTDYIILIAYPLSIMVATLTLLTLNNNLFNFSIFIIVAFCLLITLKVFTLKSIRLYQAYAPERIRRKCRFVPSCSEYTYVSITKYGLISGLLRGMKRIWRCSQNNGGTDNP